MKPFMLNGQIWRVVRLMPGDPYLVDWKGMPKIAVANSNDRIIAISWSFLPPKLDRVLLHEIGHAVTMAYGLQVDEASAQLIEHHAIEALVLAAEVLGRPVCVDGTCI